MWLQQYKYVMPMRDYDVMPLALKTILTDSQSGFAGGWLDRISPC